MNKASYYSSGNRLNGLLVWFKIQYSACALLHLWVTTALKAAEIMRYRQWKDEWFVSVRPSPVSAEQMLTSVWDWYQDIFSWILKYMGLVSLWIFQQFRNILQNYKQIPVTDEEATAALLVLKKHMKLLKKNIFLLMVGLLLKEISNSTISSNSIQGNLFIRLKHTHALKPQKNPILWHKAQLHSSLLSLKLSLAVKCMNIQKMWKHMNYKICEENSSTQGNCKNSTWAIMAMSYTVYISEQSVTGIFSIHGTLIDYNYTLLPDTPNILEQVLMWSWIAVWASRGADTAVICSELPGAVPKPESMAPEDTVQPEEQKWDVHRETNTTTEWFPQELWDDPEKNLFSEG